jgi:hypothetical protein
MLDVAVWVLAMLLAPFLPAFATSDNHLPWWLSWFDTPDNPLDGDEGYIEEHAPFKGVQTGWKKYVNRVCWLWRNPAYGFSYSVTGVRVDSVPILVSGNSHVSNDPDLDQQRATGLSGHAYIRYKHYFEYYWVYQYGKSSNCFRLRLGWKLAGFINLPQFFPLGANAQFVSSVKPFCHFAN